MVYVNGKDRRRRERESQKSQGAGGVDKIKKTAEWMRKHRLDEEFYMKLEETQRTKDFPKGKPESQTKTQKGKK